MVWDNLWSLKSIIVWLRKKTNDVYILDLVHRDVHIEDKEKKKEDIFCDCIFLSTQPLVANTKLDYFLPDTVMIIRV